MGGGFFWTFLPYLAKKVTVAFFLVNGTIPKKKFLISEREGGAFFFFKGFPRAQLMRGDFCKGERKKFVKASHRFGAV